MNFIRIDDIGASTKEFNLYGRNTFSIYKKIISFPPILSNFLILKRIPFLSGWAKYRELEFNDWLEIINILKARNSKLNIAITACWVNKNGELQNFKDKYPEQVEIIKYGVKENLFYILNHGLTHCIPGRHLPLKFGSVQKFHREFTSYLSLEKQFMHLRESQRILEEIFGKRPRILTPPGNMYNEDTLISMKKIGLNIIQCDRNKSHQPSDEILLNYGIKHIPNDNIQVIHDRDIVKGDYQFFQRLMSQPFLENSESFEKLIN